MQIELKNTQDYPAEKPFVKPPDILNVLVAYDNICSGINAKELCDRLNRRLEPAYELHLSLWSFSALQVPLLAESAAHEAAQADLFIVAVNGGQALPSSFKSWVSQCLRKIRAHGGVLAAQLHDIFRMQQELSPAYGCLQHLADDAHVKFFAEVVDSAADRLADSLESLHQRAQLHSPVWVATIPAHQNET